MDEDGESDELSFPSRKNKDVKVKANEESKNVPNCSNMVVNLYYSYS